MKKNIGKLLYVFITVCVLLSCTSPINIDTNDTHTRLVVFGAFSQDTVRNYVSISKSMSYFNTNPPIAITGAEVTVTAENIVYQLLPDTVAGRYYIDSLEMVVGREYVLDIYLDFDENGVNEHYQAKSTMVNTPRIDSVRLSNIVIQKMPIMFVYGEIYNTTENNFCIYNWKNSDTIGMFDYVMIMSSQFLQSTVKVYPTPYFVRKGIKKGDTLNLRIDNFSNTYSRFISQVSSEMSMKNPWFSSPPAEVITNIKCLDSDVRVSGFFSTYSRGQVFSVISDIDFSFGSMGDS